MKIDSSLKPVGGPTEAPRQKPAGRSAAGAAAAGGEQVQVSTMAARLQEAEGVLTSTPAVDAGRVAEIKPAIAEGRFQVNPERIADGLEDSVRQLLASRR